MLPFFIPVAKCDDTDLGQDLAVTAVEATLGLDAGWYILASSASAFRWRVGAVALTNTTGKFIGRNDQEVIVVPTDGSTLRVIRDVNETQDGSCNINVVEAIQAPGRDPRSYNSI